MNAKQFVACWRKEKDALRDIFTDSSGESAVARKIASLNLLADQKSIMTEIVDDILVDTFYTLLLGLDGEAKIGGVQAVYKIHDEEGKIISAPGEIEAEAWQLFHGDNKMR